MVFTLQLKVKPAKCIFHFRWSWCWSCYFGLGLKNFVFVLHASLLNAHKWRYFPTDSRIYDRTVGHRTTKFGKLTRVGGAYFQCFSHDHIPRAHCVPILGIDVRSCLGLRPMTTALRKFCGMEKGVKLCRRVGSNSHCSGESLPFPPSFASSSSSLLPPLPLPPFSSSLPLEIDP